MVYGRFWPILEHVKFDHIFKYITFYQSNVNRIDLTRRKKKVTRNSNRSKSICPNSNMYEKKEEEEEEDEEETKYISHQ